ncbi:MAG: hypothetical protein E3J21_08770 [Anaerolineales bacterium]|jgi:hypothetical protein|nr:MAG: hypothetical protein E3J21_08770 [Anaerolineales bacterium]
MLQPAPNAERITVFAVDDYNVVRTGLCFCLNAYVQTISIFGCRDAFGFGLESVCLPDRKLSDCVAAA